MADPFLGEIRTFAFGYEPVGWLACRGQLLPISEFQGLFALLGTTYGGDGKTTFALPDLQGRVVVAQGGVPGGAVHRTGERGGEEAHRLTEAELPRHRHGARANTSPGTADSPANAVWAAGRRRYAHGGGTGMSRDAIAPAGDDQPHNTMQPYLTLNVCIAVFGQFPPQP